MSRVLRRKVVRDLLLHKPSIIALILVMGFGIGAMVGFASMARDLNIARLRYFDLCRMGHFFTQVRRAPAETARALEALPNVQSVRGRVNLKVSLDLPDEPQPVQGYALSLPARRRPVMNDVMPISGTWFSAPGAAEVLLHEAFARANGLVPGSRIRAMLLDKQHDLLVVGTVASPEFVYLIPPGGGIAPNPKLFGVLYFEESFLQEAGDLSGAFNEFVGTFDDRSPAAVTATLESIRRAVDTYGGINTDVTEEQLSTKFLINEIENMRRSSFISPVIFLGVAMLVLNVLTSRLVQQQRLTIGTLKALGLSDGEILRHYLAYGVAIGGGGLVAGLGLSVVVQSSFVELYRVVFSFPTIQGNWHWDLYLIGAVVSLGAAALGTVKGVRTAARLHPAEAMKPPPPERANHTPLERFPALWRRLPFRWKMVFRDIFRNPFRSAVSIASATAATMLVVGALGMREAVFELVRFDMTRMQAQDLTINLRDPRGFGLDAEERLVAGETEAQLVVPCDLRNGALLRRVGITGVPQDARLFRVIDAQHNPVPIPRAGLVMSRKLAELLDVAPGDTLLMKPLLGERREVTAVVSGIADTYVGLGAYADIGYLSRLIGEEWAANAILVRQIGGTPDAELLARTKELPTALGVARRLEAMRLFEETFSKINGVIIGTFVVFAMFIGFGAVLNASLVSLSEREREVGTLRVLGFESREVAFVFFAESAVLNGVGIVLGLYLGVAYIEFLAAAYSSEMFRMPVVLNPLRFVQSFVLMLVALVGAQLLVFRMIHKLNWLDALKVRE